MALVGASCNSAKKDGGGGHDPVPKPVGPKAVDEEITGVSLTDLRSEERQQFFRLLDGAPSPCGKPQSLRASIKTDKDCKRAVFAARYVKKLSALGLDDESLLKVYKDRYQQDRKIDVDLTGAPYEGVPNAPVVIIEFFDYSCPHCKMMLPVLEDAVAEFPSDVVVYFMHFPLGGASHPHSMPLAQAAVAAMRQGKFREMHRKLFAAQDDDQSEPAIMKIARDIGLDMAKFVADYKDPRTVEFIEAQRKQAEKAKVSGTPSIFVNGRLYSDAPEFDWFKSWIEEEIAVTR